MFRIADPAVQHGSEVVSLPNAVPSRCSRETWQGYWDLLVDRRIKETVRPWYARHVEAYLEAVGDRHVELHVAGDVERYLDLLGPTRVARGLAIRAGRRCPSAVLHRSGMCAVGRGVRLGSLERFGATARARACNARPRAAGGGSAGRPTRPPPTQAASRRGSRGAPRGGRPARRGDPAPRVLDPDRASVLSLDVSIHRVLRGK